MVNNMKNTVTIEFENNKVEPHLHVYIAGASTPEQVARVRRWSARLAEVGIVVISTWPGVIAAAGAGNQRDAPATDRRRWSVQDLHELGKADVLWLLCPPPGETTRGAWVELGAAYAFAKLIIASGDTRQSIFTALGAEYPTDEEAFEALRVSCAERAG